MGLRELKKEKTRKLISDLATRLFVERGYDTVTTEEIAQLAQVSKPTLFKYFPLKAMLVFDEDEAKEAQLISAVLERKKGVSLLQAIRNEFMRSDALKPEHLKHVRAFRKLIDSTPELATYERTMWMRYEQALARAIRKSSKIEISEFEADCLAHFLLDTFYRALSTTNPVEKLEKFYVFLNGRWQKTLGSV